MKSEDDYIRLFDEFEERINAADPDQQIKAVARKEAEGVVNRYAIFLITAWLCYWLHDRYDVPLWVLATGAILIFVVWINYLTHFDPATGKGQITLQAEKIARLRIVRDVFEAGDACWQVDDREQFSDDKAVVVADHNQWQGFWKRAYEVALALERLPPYKRERLVKAAVMGAIPALETGDALAKATGTPLIYWAKDCLP